jgi:hypothetical protein
MLKPKVNVSTAMQFRELGGNSTNLIFTEKFYFSYLFLFQISDILPSVPVQR